MVEISFNHPVVQIWSTGAIMANEELVQRGYLTSGELRGSRFGIFEELNLGATTVRELVSVGVSAVIPQRIPFSFKQYSIPKKPHSARPDRIFFQRRSGALIPIAVGEHKRTKGLKNEKEKLRAAEQALFSAAALGARVAMTTNGSRYSYIDVSASLAQKKMVYFAETRDFNPGVLQNLLLGDAGLLKDPKPLAENVWQIIWHATKSEPKECLLTFVEIFVLKFLSDNLPRTTLPEAYTFYTLTIDAADFERKHGQTAIEYYITTVRPQIKKLFPDNVIAQDATLGSLFGLGTIVSKTSVINGFAFLKSSQETLSGFNRTFLEILSAFQEFGPLTAIDPEFKLRLYETFLRRSARQQKLGQFFTPRNVVRSMVKMARLGELADGAVVLDPAAGVGGFVLEPTLFPDSLPGNLKFEKGLPRRKVKTIGIDVDPNLHILAKANMLIHLAEALRSPTTTLQGLNMAMADTFVLMNGNETLGALENPPQETVDVILTNPPYVTQGSAIYKKELSEIKGMRNGIDIRDYYDGCGLGVESLFLRYVYGALKPGGRAFIIVPLGLLNRTENGPKQKLLDACNIIASISLPRNTFFNTAQKTYILALERRRTESEPRPDVICGIARSIGESLDWRRIPTPEANDLGAIADAFVAIAEGKKPAPMQFMKLIAADEFRADDRWDVARFWSDGELVQLGERDSPMEKLEFIDEARTQIQEILTELSAAKAELEVLTSGPSRETPLSDKSLYSIRSGARITTENVRMNRGDIPVYSCFKEAKITKGSISELWLKKKGIDVESGPLVTVNANGASIGKVFVRNERCVLTDDVIAVEILGKKIDPEFLAVQLRGAIESGNFVYEAKLFVGRVRELVVRLPVRPDGTLDISQQRRIASAVKRFDTLRQRLHELGQWSGSARVS